MSGKPKRYSTPGPRFIYPSVSQSVPLADCSPLAQLLFDRLIAQADDQGRLNGEPRSVKVTCVPLIDDATPDAIEQWLSELAGQNLIIRYAVQGRRLIQIRRWWEHQQAMRWSYPSRYPAPDGWADRVKVRQAPGDEPEPKDVPDTFGTCRNMSARPDLTLPDSTLPDLTLIRPDSDPDPSRLTIEEETIDLGGKTPRPPDITVEGFVQSLCNGTDGAYDPEAPFRLDDQLAPEAWRKRLLQISEAKGVGREQLGIAREIVTHRSSSAELTVRDAKKLAARLDDPEFVRLIRTQ